MVHRALEPNTPVTWVGLGSNLLVRDAGIRGVVVATHKCLKRIEPVGDNRIYIESGVPGAKIARYSTMRDLTGAEFFAGIPGTFGGALAMNAGAFGSETWDVVCKVETLDRSRARSAADLPWSSRLGIVRSPYRPASGSCRARFCSNPGTVHREGEKDPGLPGPACHQPTDPGPECRIGVQEPRRGLCRQADRKCRPEGNPPGGLR